VSVRPDKNKKRKKKKKEESRSQTAVADASGRALYVDLLATLEPSLDPLAEELSERDGRRSLHLFHLLTLLRPFFDGLSQLYGALLWLARLPGVDDDVAYLLREAAQQVVSGMESMLAEPDPRVLDEARRLMEIEFLFFEFTRSPERLDVWRAVSERERTQEFGFDVLRQREEIAQGIPAEKVLFDQEEYRMHSSAVHPQPLSRRLSVSPPDLATGLFYDAGDLLHHASRVWTAGLAAAKRTGSSSGDGFDARLPPLDAVDAAKQMMEENSRNLGLLE
jgi:hypothetical protein